ncbi:MAG TPA: hypothetical protein VMZ26_18420 [Pyrinomonadaceae bacterium]|nr:hypothetical protein [Pyrinomonadaceae bacterium]
MISRFKPSTVTLLVLCFVHVSFGQQAADTKEEKKAASASATKEEKKASTSGSSRDAKNLTPEQIAESTIFIYGSGGGRTVLNQIRKTAIERGKISVTTPEGRTDQATYHRWTQRAETLSKEKIRLDQEFPNSSYSLIFNDERIFGIVDSSVFTPREDASRAFENQIIHGLEALLRYKENESKIESAGKEKVFGVEYHLLDVTDKQSRRTRFYISAKTYRVMMLDYDQAGVKYRRRFYDYNYAQGTLVPFRTALWADEKLVEETEVGTITFGQKIDETIFSAG